MKSGFVVMGCNMSGNLLNTSFPMIGKMAKKSSNDWKIVSATLGVFFCAFLMVSNAGFIGWASGGVDAEGGVLLATTNGVDWFRQGTGQFERVDLGGVSSFATGHVWVVGAETGGYGTVFYSADAGVSWVRQGDTNTIPSCDLSKPCSVDDQVVWVVGYNGTVLRTTDGGTTWGDVSITGYTQALQGVTAIDAQTAWVSGGSDSALGFAGLFQTTNGGVDWTRQTQGYVTNVDHILGLSAVDAQHIWAIGGNETILYSTNAGAEWMLKNTGTMKDGNEIYTRGTQDVWTACDSVLIWSHDNGTSWTNHTTSDYTMDISVPDGTNIWAVRGNYDGGEIYYSPDGGVTWITQFDHAGYVSLFKLSMQWRPEPEPQTVFYADAGSTNPVSPFASWATAATNIQDALDAADHGCTIWVTNGVYDTGGEHFSSDITYNRVLIRKAVHLKSVNGPAHTFIVGREEDIQAKQNPYRGILITDEAYGAVISGFTITNGHVTKYASMSPVDQVAGGVMMLAGTLSNCVIRNCDGSGVAFMPPIASYYGYIYDCTVFDNSGASGGGIFVAGDCTIERCRVVDNVAVLDENGQNGRGGGITMLCISDQSGGTAAPVIRDCYISGNRADTEHLNDGGGGVFWNGGQLINCTIVNNESLGMGGGIFVEYSAAETNIAPVVNCIIYHNDASEGDNYYLNSGAANVFSYCCSLPAASGIVVTDVPKVTGLYNPHILFTSPCREQGDISVVNPGEVDIDFEKRLQDGHVDIGCDEFVMTNILGPLVVDIDAPYDIVLTDSMVTFSSLTEGKADTLQWRIMTNGGFYTIGDALMVTASWANSGTYDVVLEAANTEGMNGATVTVHVLDTFTNFVSKTGTHISPFTTWVTASTNIQDAVDVCYAGGVTCVDTGTYQVSEQVVLDKPITLLAPNGYSNTIIDAQGKSRCLYLVGNQVVVDGFTLSNGTAGFGAGALLRDGTLRNCRVNTCRAELSGGGVKAYGDALVEWCLIDGNTSYGSGGGVYANINSIIRNSFIHANTAQGMAEMDGGGGGVYLTDLAEMRDCFVSDNEGWMGGGVMLLNGGWLRNCTLLANQAYGVGGGLFNAEGKACNSIIYYNEAPEYRDLYADSSSLDNVLYCCLPDNAGEGCITNRPALLGIRNPHIDAASPCIEAGSTNYVESGQRDIDDEQRVFDRTVDMGCDEYIPTNITGNIDVNIIGEFGTIVNDDVELFADISGRAQGYVWYVAAPGSTGVIADTYQISPIWTNVGTYSVILAASNLTMMSAVTVQVQVIEGRFTNYVSKAGTHVSPFTSLATAATNIQDAIDACYADGVVMVDTGVFQEVAEILLDRPVTLQGLAGRNETVLDGNNVQRVIRVNHDRARLENLTVANGLAEHGAGVYIMDGIISNCVVSSCGSTNVTGGGIYAVGDSKVCDSDIDGNTAFYSGGIIAANHSAIERCTIRNNVAVDKGAGIRLMQNAHILYSYVEGNLLHQGRGGGIFLEAGGEVGHCIVNSNAAQMGAGVYLEKGGSVSNTMIELSWGFWFGGGFIIAQDGIIKDSTIRNNYSIGGTGGGGIMSGEEINAKQLLNCLVYDNTSKDAAGVHMENGGLIQDCAIYHNSASNDHSQKAKAGGVWVFRLGTLNRCLIYDNYSEDQVGGVGLESGGELRNCLIYGNEADGDVGGVLLTRNENISEPRNGVVRNCTIIGNTTDGNAGGVAFMKGGDVGNTIIYGNTAFDFDEYAVDDNNDDASMNYSCAAPLFTNGVGNINSNPLFAGAPTNNYRLQAVSPCINIGLNDYWMNDATDLDGVQRIIGSAVDMGAYEYPLTPDAFSTVGGAGRIHLNWDTVQHVESYGVYRSTTATGVMTRVATVAAGTATWQDAITCGQEQYYRIVADYIADGLADVAVYSSTSGIWAIRRSSDGQPELIAWGWQDAQPAPGQYNQYCQTELAVYWPEFGNWYGCKTDTSLWTLNWGWSEAGPVRGDFDGDGLQDVAVYSADDGIWYIRRSSDTNAWDIQWGWAAASAVPGDYDGDGITDPAVFAADEGRWYIRLSTTGLWILDWGWSSTVPVVADYDGDGKDDVAVYWPEGGLWYIRQSASAGALWQVQWGWADAEAAPADYDGDGKADITVHWTEGRRWFILYSSTGLPGIFDWNYEGHAISHYR